MVNVEFLLHGVCWVFLKQLQLLTGLAVPLKEVFAQGECVNIKKGRYLSIGSEASVAFHYPPSLQLSGDLMSHHIASRFWDDSWASPATKIADFRIKPDKCLLCVA
jgi:hypothetical protein